MLVIVITNTSSRQVPALDLETQYDNKLWFIDKHTSLRPPSRRLTTLGHAVTRAIFSGQRPKVTFRFRAYFASKG